VLFETSKIFKVGEKYVKIEKHTRGARGVWGVPPLMRSAATRRGVGDPSPPFSRQRENFFQQYIFRDFFHYGFVSEKR